MGGRVKLSEKQVIDIRKKLKSCAFVRALAREYGVNKTTVARIRDRKLWNHI